MAALASRRNGGRALLLLLLAALAVGGGRRLWIRVEPAGRWPLLPSPWPLALPAPAAGSSAPLRLESPGWRQRSLGNPARQRYPHCWQARARTPWDLILWQQQLYLGLGDSSNEGPTANGGPVPLLRYDPRRRLWHQDASLPEEAVERFVAAGDRLWIPGADARGSWRWGNVYRHRSGGQLWWQERRLPGFIHVHDLIPWRGALVVAGSIEHAVPAGLGSETNGSAVAVSADGGQHWSVTPLGGWRSTALLPVAGQLYGLEALPGPALQRWLLRQGRQARFHAVHQWQGGGAWIARPDLTAAALLPEVPEAARRFAWLEGVQRWGDGAAWIAAIGPAPGAKATRQAFVASNLAAGRVAVQRLPLPAGAMAMDLSTTASGPVVLSSEPSGPGQWLQTIVQFHQSTAGWQPRPLLQFRTAAPAQSLAGQSGHWFLGLGPAPGEPGETPPSRSSCTPAQNLSGTVVEVWR
jgi:hypothetical protein